MPVPDNFLNCRCGVRAVRCLCFPQTLFDVQYPAPGRPELAKETKQLITKTAVGLDDKWGLDHGAWSVIKHLYPNADVPVVQMSIDYSQNAQYHYELAKQ